MVCAISKASDQPAHMHSLIRVFASHLTVKLLTKHHLEFLSLKRGCTGSTESTLVKMAHCWKSHVAAHFFFFTDTSLWYVGITDQQTCGKIELIDFACIQDLHRFENYYTGMS